ncbi:MAG TPA: hypothetical protein GXX57_00460 [Firmicutes bacterium]|nr:hypothetical protein [Bacillota bacterium]
MALKQNYLVYRDGDVFRVVGQVDGKQLAVAEDASRAIQTAVDSLTSGGRVILSNDTFPIGEPIRLGTGLSYAAVEKQRSWRLALEMSPWG